MKLSLAVYAAPHSSQASHSALQFVRAAVRQHHDIYRVFFYQDGVHNATALSAPPQDEPDMVTQWQALARDHDIDLVVCIAAALRRGVLDESEQSRYEKPANNLAAGFVLGGLGQLLDAAVSSDRLITFGG